MQVSIDLDQLIEEQYPNIAPQNIVLCIDIPGTENILADTKPKRRRPFSEYTPLEIQKILDMAG